MIIKKEQRATDAPKLLKEAGLSAWGSPCNESHCWELFRQTPKTTSALGDIPAYKAASSASGSVCRESSGGKP